MLPDLPGNKKQTIMSKLNNKSNDKIKTIKLNKTKMEQLMDINRQFGTRAKMVKERSYPAEFCMM
jgi:hypothetical protein